MWAKTALGFQHITAWSLIHVVAWTVSFVVKRHNFGLHTKLSNASLAPITKPQTPEHDMNIRQNVLKDCCFYRDNRDGNR